MARRLTRAVKAITAWCRKHIHEEVVEQHRALSLKLKGHNAYYGVTGNWDALARFKDAVEETWRKWLNRRSQKARMWWPKFKRLLKRYPLPKPIVVHSIYRSQRSRNPRSRMR